MVKTWSQLYSTGIPDRQHINFLYLFYFFFATIFNALSIISIPFTSLSSFVLFGFLWWLTFVGPFGRDLLTQKEQMKYLDTCFILFFPSCCLPSLLHISYITWFCEPTLSALFSPYIFTFLTQAFSLVLYMFGPGHVPSAVFWRTGFFKLHSCPPFSSCVLVWYCLILLVFTLFPFYLVSPFCLFCFALIFCLFSLSSTLMTNILVCTIESLFFCPQHYCSQKKCYSFYLLL